MSLLIRDVPVTERPRERLLQNGAAVLSNQEIIAILLRTGTKKDSVIDLAGKVLAHFDGLPLLKEATIEELCEIGGIGTAKAVELSAAMELGRRIHSMQTAEKYVIRSPEDVSNLVMEEMRFLKQEHFVCLYLNTKNQLLFKHTVFIGSLNASIVHPREVFKEALRRSSASIICLHNHPSGDPTPSREDIDVTKRLYEAGRVLGIELLDHIIIGDRTFISLKEQGHVG
ncbi:RadC family protein [Alkalicoccobacillus porphyridii]|uniref:JAB domain-containing protein n=1 Tax=Alkalicoccobacillus porphyridii TaxID=2597270 RepID=A0A553ZXR3_9BACI|nr:DNA repair protein RadC [Alkalicoccobacillus porphyridii]TSB46233.1 JAB domain-containing protein [Alkalicoccobacillus porphyridii]